jgi:hypothetical protein
MFHGTQLISEKLFCGFTKIPDLWGYSNSIIWLVSFSSDIHKSKVAAGQLAFVASPEKAILDLIYLTPGADAKEYLKQLRLQILDSINVPNMMELAKQSRKPKLKRAVRLVGPLLKEERGESI